MRSSHNCRQCATPLTRATLATEPVNIEARPHRHGTLTPDGIFDGKPRMQRPQTIHRSVVFRYREHTC